jgi:hypothetical protein
MARGVKSARARELAEAYAKGIARGLGLPSFIPPTVQMRAGDKIIDAMRSFARDASGVLLRGEDATRWLEDQAEEFALNANPRAISGGFKPWAFADYLNDLAVKRAGNPLFTVAMPREFIDAIRRAWRRAGNEAERLIDISDRETLLVVRDYARQAAEASVPWAGCSDADLALIVEYWLVKLFKTSDEFLISQGYPLKALLWSDSSRMKAYGVPQREISRGPVATREPSSGSNDGLARIGQAVLAGVAAANVVRRPRP